MDRKLSLLLSRNYKNSFPLNWYYEDIILATKIQKNQAEDDDEPGGIMLSLSSR